MSTRNSLAALEGASALFAAGNVASDGTGTILAPRVTAGDVVTTKTGTGVYTVTINPFKGPQGKLVTVATLKAASGIIRVESETYTGDSVVITVKTFAVDGTSAADKAFNFQIFAA